MKSWRRERLQCWTHCSERLLVAKTGFVYFVKVFDHLFQKVARIQRRGALVAAPKRRNSLYGVSFCKLKSALPILAELARPLFICASFMQRKSD
jgi:hypothetical protein